MSAPAVPSRAALQKVINMEGPLGNRNTRSGAIINFLSFMKTLSYVIGITLGVGSIFSGVWSVSMDSLFMLCDFAAMCGMSIAKTDGSCFPVIVEIPSAITLLDFFSKESSHRAAALRDEDNRSQIESNPFKQEDIPTSRSRHAGCSPNGNR